MKTETLSLQNIDRIIEMAWEDRTPFEVIELQFGLSQKEVITLMRQQMKTAASKCGASAQMAAPQSTRRLHL